MQQTKTLKLSGIYKNLRKNIIQKDFEHALCGLFSSTVSRDTRQKIQSKLGVEGNNKP